MARLRSSHSQANSYVAQQPLMTRADSPSSSSDKENSTAQSSARKMNGSTTQDSDAARSGKRRRLAERPGLTRANASREQDEGESEDNSSTSQVREDSHLQYYDPFQSQAERQVLRKDMRDLNNEANDNRQQWIQPGNDSLLNAIERSNIIYGKVKQTSDATIDSKFLVTAGDLARRRTDQLVMGDSSQGIDVDEFMGKAIAWMRQGTVSSRARALNPDSDDDDGDALDWAKLGRACFRYNRRPPLPSFLLGPLAVRKRTRLQRANNEPKAMQRNVVETRPEEIDHTQIGANDAGPTAMSHGIHKIIRKAQRQIRSWTAEMAEEGLSQSEISERLVEEGFSSTGAIPFFKLVVNPSSFGQTVENMFYASFLIKDGLYGLDADEDGLLCILPKASLPDSSAATQEQQDKDAQTGNRHQAIFTLDHALWRDIVDSFEIQECLIPHRGTEEEATTTTAAPAVGASGWYS